MKKLLPILLPLLILSALAVYFVYNPKSSSTIEDTEKGFAVRDTAAIDVIEIQNPKYAKMKLRRAESGWWYVNDKWLARPDKIDLLLQTFTKIRAKKPVAKVAEDNIASTMKKATRIKLYDKEGMQLKSYLLGTTNSSRSGNYMQLEGAAGIFLAYIPGFEGYFSPRFIPKISDWRFPRVFNHGPHNISELTVEYPEEPKASFIIKKKGEDFSFSRLEEAHPKDASVPQNLLRAYLKNFRNLNAEAFENEYEKIDSIRNATPHAIITLTNDKGDKREAVFYKRKVYKRTKVSTEDDGSVREYDIDRFFGLINERRDFVLLQNFVFSDVLRKHEEFLP